MISGKTSHNPRISLTKDQGLNESVEVYTLLWGWYREPGFSLLWCTSNLNFHSFFNLCSCLTYAHLSETLNPFNELSKWGWCGLYVNKISSNATGDCSTLYILSTMPSYSDKENIRLKNLILIFRTRLYK